MHKIHIKTPEEIARMKEGGVRLSEVMRRVLSEVQPGVTLAALDALAQKEIDKRDAFPSFKMVKGYRWSICASVNEGVVHGIPDAYVVKTGDVVGIDCGIFYQGMHTDSSWTIHVKTGKYKKESVDTFLEVGKKALDLAMSKVKVGNYIFDISSAIQDTVEGGGYSVVKSLVGHGIGFKLHEAPEVPGIRRGMKEETPHIVEGLALAIEVIYTMGSPEVVYRGNDDWTIITKDAKISGLFEATVVATFHGCLVLTERYAT